MTIVAIFHLSLAAPAFAETATPWLILSDIHLDPTGRHADGTLGQDTNPELFASALAELRAVVPKPSVVVIDGDFLAHIFASRRAVPTMQAIARSFDRAFPNAQFVLVLGNEDSDCGDYGIAPDSSFLRATARAWEPLVDRRGAAPSFLRTFAHDGFYVASLPRPGLRAIVVDDVFWSPRYFSRCGHGGNPSLASLRELRGALMDRDTRRAMIFAHIPPGIDAYTTTHLTHGLIYVPFLKQRAKDDFLTTLSESATKVAVVVTGHTHKFSFRVAGDDERPVPFLSVPSVSPIFLNEPSFLVAHVESDGTVADATEWSRLHDRWSRIGGSRSLGMAAVNGRAILDLQAREAADPALRALGSTLYDGGLGWEITPQNWRMYWCSATAFSTSAFRDCSGKGGIGIFTARGVGLIAGGVAFLAVCCVGVAMLFRKARRRARRRAVVRTEP